MDEPALAPPSERRHRQRQSVLCAVVVALLTLMAAGTAQATDSNAPPGSPAHWLPNEQWVKEHWLPYDEGRLYGLLHITRQQLWDQLRDDTRNIAELALGRGWRAGPLAAALVAPRASSVSTAKLATLRERALRTLTQGHLAQHLFFHSLHEFAVPSSAPAIFGVHSVTEYQSLRRAELSPVMICHLNSRSLAQTESATIATLRAQARSGVSNHDFTPAQARLLLGRQLSQVPRWLQQTRYNGPPPLRRNPGALLEARNYANNPAMSADGLHVVFDGYQAKPGVAKVAGEIRVAEQNLATGRGTAIGLPPQQGGKPNPSSSYNPSVSGNGRYVVFEASLGNLNFAKRYGKIKIYRRDLLTHRDKPVSLEGSATVSDPPSAYNPSISDDGRYVVYESAASKPGGIPGSYQLDIYLRDMTSGTSTLVSRSSGPGGARADADVFDPRISGNGRYVVFTTVARNLVRTRLPGLQSRVYVRDLRTGATTLVSRASGMTGAVADADAYEPRISADGSHVAFTSLASNLRPSPASHASAVYVRDRRTQVTALASRASGRNGAPAASTASQPSISADGRYVAFVSGAHDLVSDAQWPGAHRMIFRRDMHTASTALVSRRDGWRGRPTEGDSSEPSISADGRRVTFTSVVGNQASTTPQTRSPLDLPNSQVIMRDLALSKTVAFSLPGAGPAPPSRQLKSVGGGRTAVVLLLTGGLALLTSFGFGAALLRRHRS